MRLKRVALFFVTCLACVTLEAAEPPSVKLLLVRDATLQPQCNGRVMAGRLYGVPPGVDLSSGDWLQWALEPIADTMEIPWEDNLKNASAIPNGTYEATVKEVGTKPWMWSSGRVDEGRLLKDRAWRLELVGVPGHRSGIQFHYGKDASWSTGCVILVASSPDALPIGCNPGDSPESAVSKLRDYVESRAKASGSRISIRVVDGRLPKR